MFIQIGISVSTSEIRTWQGRRNCENCSVGEKGAQKHGRALPYPSFPSQNISRPGLFSENLTLVAEKGVT